MNFKTTDTWILAPKLQVTRIQFTDHMQLKKRKTKVWMLWSFLGGGKKKLNK
jgi:hypothetical protein